MTAKVRVIDAEPVTVSPVEYAQHVLKRAQAGEFSAIMFAYVYRDGSTGSGFSQQHNLATSIGAVEGLKTKLIRRLLG